MLAAVRTLAGAITLVSVGADFPLAASEAASDNGSPGQIWFALYSSQGGPARFVSIGPGSGVVYVEATSPNLEVASVRAVRRGSLSPQTVDRVNAVRQLLDTMGPDAVASLRSGEAIERSGIFLDIGACREGARSYFGLMVDALPAAAAESLRLVAAEAARLDSRTAPSVIRVLPVDSERAKQIRADPRGIYTFVSLTRDLLESMPHLKAAFDCPGIVGATDENEDARLRVWLRQSNPKMMGQTLFLSLERSDFQIHFQSLPGPE